MMNINVTKVQFEHNDLLFLGSSKHACVVATVSNGYARESNHDKVYHNCVMPHLFLTALNTPLNKYHAFILILDRFVIKK